jgi:hypothetical protein
MSLKPQDILILLKLVVVDNAPHSYASFAKDILLGRSKPTFRGWAPEGARAPRGRSETDSSCAENFLSRAPEAQDGLEPAIEPESPDERPWSFSALAHELFLSPSEVHAGIKRAERSHLLDSVRRRPLKKPLEEFLVCCVKYVFPSVHGGLTRGIPTAYAAPPFVHQIVQSTEPCPVWPYPEGHTRGLEFSPLYRSVPSAALKDRRLYELLVVVDVLREGRARERELAIAELRKRLRTS